jgi:hypothetical protein
MSNAIDVYTAVKLLKTSLFVWLTRQNDFEYCLASFVVIRHQAGRPTG